MSSHTVFWAGCQKKYPLFFVLVLFVLITKLFSIDFPIGDKSEIIGEVINIAVLVGVGAFLSKVGSREVQAEVVLFAIKGSSLIVAMLIIVLSVGDLLKYEFGAVPYLLIGLVLLPIWEFCFGLYRHYGKLTIFRVITLLVLGFITFLQLEA